jgi:hypothetical protein
MVDEVSASYPELWHCTDAAGLRGILQTQQLWATNIRYLNDGEELTGFFDRRRLLELLEEGVTLGIENTQASGQEVPVLRGSNITEMVRNFQPERLLASLRTITLNLAVYVTSF